MNELLPHKKTHKHKHCIQTHTLARLFIFKRSSCSSLMKPDWINHNWDPLRHIPNLFITIQLMNFTLLKWRRREWGSLYFTGVSVHYKSSLSDGKRSSGMRARSDKGMDNALWLVTCLGRMHFISAWDRDDWLDMRSTRIPLIEEWQRLMYKQHATKRYPTGKNEDLPNKSTESTWIQCIFVFLWRWVSLYFIVQAEYRWWHDTDCGTIDSLVVHARVKLIQTSIGDNGIRKQWQFINILLYKQFIYCSCTRIACFLTAFQNPPLTPFAPSPLL